MSASVCEGGVCDSAECPVLAPERLASSVGGRVESGNVTLGYLCVGSHAARPVDPDDRRVLSGLASLAAIAIETGRLHHEVRSLARLEERERIAADLHDGIIQTIYATGLGLEECRRVLTDDPAGARVKLDEALVRLNVVIRDVRNYVVGLEPEALQDRGLAQALEDLARELMVNGLLQTEVELDPAVDPALTREQKSELFHISREALTNVLKHAGDVPARLTLVRSDGHVRLAIADGGRGFDPTGSRGLGWGLRNLAERARRLGASFDVDSGPGRGTRVAVDIPTVGR